jgi:hypothetical protein
MGSSTAKRGTRRAPRAKATPEVSSVEEEDVEEETPAPAHFVTREAAAPSAHARPDATERKASSWRASLSASLKQKLNYASDGGEVSDKASSVN